MSLYFTASAEEWIALSCDAIRRIVQIGLPPKIGRVWLFWNDGPNNRVQAPLVLIDVELPVT
jgi:hypothetical protein